jgi:hypothetical protein
MFYQSFKYFLIRTGLTLFLVLVLGYMSLYFAHEVALPNVYFNDLWIKWTVVGICLFFGFVVYGIFGEHRFLSSQTSLKHIDLKAVGPEIREQFQNLVEFTGSSYFLPGKGRELREQLVQDYAEFLMSTGSEDPEALNVFLKAFLQDPKQTRFRNVLVSTLARKEELTDQEIDLMLVIMKTEGYEDRELLNHMVIIFLKQEWFTNKSEPIFLKALQLKTGQENNIISFMLPHLLDKKRTDYLAMNFYLESLSSLPEEQRETIAFLVSTSYCEERFQVLDPDLHARCKQVFDSLEAETQERLLRMVKDAKVAERWKRVKLFHSDDKRALERLKVYTGLSPTFWQVVGKKVAGLGSGVFNLIKKAVFKVFDGLNIMGSMNTATKLVLAGLIFGGMFYAAVAVDWKTLIQGQMVTPPAPPKPLLEAPLTKTFTIQIAAVKSKSKADESVRWLKKKKVKEVYVVKIPRTTEGFWYKVRVGKFSKRETAEQFAKRLLEKKTIRSYFIIALDGHPKA